MGPSFNRNSEKNAKQKWLVDPKASGDETRFDGKHKLHYR